MQTKNIKRSIIQWIVLPVVIITIVLGWKYPILGFSAPIVMIAGIISGFINRRYICGNLSPRGAFFDCIMACFCKNVVHPGFMKSLYLRIIIFIVLIVAMIFQILQKPYDWRHWGLVFWRMCVITTTAGIILGILFHSRTWCIICPVGTFQHIFGKNPAVLIIDSKSCKECYRCEKFCPMHIHILDHKKQGIVTDRDCIKCLECVMVCPSCSLAFKRPNDSCITG
jgi:polyferredoxin